MDVRKWFSRVIVLFLAAFFALGAVGQTPDLSFRPGVAAHSGVDDIYRRFSEAYRTLNVELVADQYTQSAAYLAPDDDILTGRDNIRPVFKRFFDSVRNNGQTMSISFDIAQRMVDKTIGYDVGVFTLRTLKEGKEINKGQGKFVVVTVKGTDGKWRFQVDGYNDLKPTAPRQ